ncbi:MAG: chemotaxis response regulator protein-glutamate methylesterase [Planctomycetota bacterium]
MNARPIKVLIVDDMRVVRDLLKEIFSSDPGVEVVGEASDPIEARALIKSARPDVITLDVEMPRMDGLTFLRKLMRINPLPVVMISSLTQQGAEETLDALEIGAVDVVGKSVRDGRTLADQADEILEKVKNAAAVRRTNLDLRISAQKFAKEVDRRREGVDEIPFHEFSEESLVAIGGSIGGTEAIREVVEVLPPGFCPVVVVQHLPAGFSASLASRLDDASRVQVREATDGAVLERGTVWVAPGGHHLTVEEVDGKRVCRLSDGDPLHGQRPSIEVLFDSVRRVAAEDATAVLLTGMGKDGAEALLGLKEAGAKTVAQDEETSVAWGLPGEAARLGAVDQLCAVDEIATALVQIEQQRARSVKG